MATETFDIWGQQTPAGTSAIFPNPAGEPDNTPAQLATHGQLLALANSAEANEADLIINALATAYYAQAGSNAAENLRQAVLTANAQVRQQRPTPAGTTLVAAVWKQGMLHAINVGNSRAYLVRQGQAWSLTRDHVTAEGGLSRILVRTPFLEPDIYRPLALEQEDRVLLCTPGLYHTLPAKALARTAGRGTAQEAITALLAQVASNNAAALLAQHPPRPAGARLTTTQKAILGILSLITLLMFAWFLLETWLTLTAGS